MLLDSIKVRTKYSKYKYILLRTYLIIKLPVFIASSCRFLLTSSARFLRSAASASQRATLASTMLLNRSAAAAAAAAAADGEADIGARACSGDAVLDRRGKSFSGQPVSLVCNFDNLNLMGDEFGDAEVNALR